MQSFRPSGYHVKSQAEWSPSPQVASRHSPEAQYPFSAEHYNGARLDENGRIVGSSASPSTSSTSSGYDFSSFSNQETQTQLPFQPPPYWTDRYCEARPFSQGLGQPTNYLDEQSRYAQSSTRKRHSLPPLSKGPLAAPLPEDGGPIPDGRVMDDPHAIDAHDLFWAKTITPEFHSVVERKRKENKADDYNPFATFSEWNACANYERKNRHALPQYKVRKLADGTRGILKYAVGDKAPEHLRCLPSSELLNSCYDCGQKGEHAAACEYHREVGGESYLPVSDDPRNLKRRCAAPADDYNYKDPSENKEDGLMTKAWDTVKWKTFKKPIMAMRARRKR
ncbi:hypothetical protein CKK34_3762 [Yarrowia sp. E02]|nr:hypothetical protein CKK34_3762 [Yarrowia sp. E02]